MPKKEERDDEYNENQGHIRSILCGHFGSLTKNEPIDFILKFAPASFVEMLRGRFANQQEVAAMLQCISNVIGAILSDEELLYEPSGFDRELLQQLERLRGVSGSHHKRSINNAIFS